jgi:ribosomal protein S30
LKGVRLTYSSTVDHAAVARAPAKKEITAITGTSSRRTSGSRIARPGRPSWSSSSHSTSGGAVRAATDRLMNRNTKTAAPRPRNSQPLRVSRVVKTLVKPTSWNHSQSV